MVLGLECRSLDVTAGDHLALRGQTLQKALDEEGRGVKLFTERCIVCMEGPQFSTRAESLMYRQWGGDLINMSVLPEAKLAREAELRFGYIQYYGDPNLHRNLSAMHLLQLLPTTTPGDRIPKRSPLRKFSRL